MEETSEHPDFLDNMLTLIQTQNSQMSQLNEKFDSMKREMSDITQQYPPKITPVSSTPHVPNRARPRHGEDEATNTGNVAYSEHPHNSSPLAPQQNRHESNPFWTDPITGNTPEMFQSMGSLIKPKDISMLKLSELHGVGTESRLTRFYSQVEFCVSSSSDRIQVALVRVEHDIATLVNAEISKVGNYITWSDFKDILNRQFIS